VAKKFVKARSNTSPTSKNVARIFEPLALLNNSPKTPGEIPISPDDQAFKEKRYWRIPVPPAFIFAALIPRLQYDTSGCKDIKIIQSILVMQSLDDEDENDGNGRPSGGGGPSGGSGLNDDNGGGGGPSGGARASSKRKAAGDKRGASGTKKARRMSGGSRTRACDESGVRARYQNQESDCCEIASSTYIPDDGDAPAHLISTGWDDDSDSENGRSVSATSPHDEDKPAEWQFGPSFSTNKIVFTARGIDLT
jgi:hypothetical protein